MKDFFISYTNADRNRATWVAELLEENNYQVTIQEWDFMPGDNFVQKIDEALKTCNKMIIILSEAYIKSKWCTSEWTSKLTEQNSSNKNKIIPIKIQPFELKGLLSPIVYINIVDKTEEEARNLILAGISKKERKSNGYVPYYSVEHKEIVLDYLVDDDIITFVKKVTFIPKEEKNKIHNRITWFADEEIVVKSLSNAVKIEKLDLHDTNFNYNVVFDHMLKVGEETEFIIEATLTNKNKHFDNFFSSEIITPTKKLCMNLTLNNQKVDKVYTQKISSSPMNVRTEDPEEHLYYGAYHWIIDNPELNFEYKIYWE